MASVSDPYQSDPKIVQPFPGRRGSGLFVPLFDAAQALVEKLAGDGSEEFSQRSSVNVGRHLVSQRQLSLSVQHGVIPQRKVWDFTYAL